MHRTLNPTLQICGMGSVSPLGLGADAMNSSSVSTGEEMDLFGGKKTAVYRAEMTKDSLSKWQKEPRLRRASPITFLMMEAASQAYIKEKFPGRLGIVSAFFTGSINYSRRFFSDVIEQGQRFASPALFPETVFNSPTSHVAHVLKADGPAYSIVGDQSAWVNAISTAWCWLKNQTVDYVLVIAAEELDPIIVQAYQRSGWMKQKGFIPSEGAGAMLLRLSESQKGVRISQVAEGFSYRSRKQAMQSAQECISGFSAHKRVLRTAQNNWFAKIENQILKEGNLKSHESHPMGEAFVASAAWNTFQGVSLLSRAPGTLLVPIWGLNHQCSALLLENG
jgi:3-oxoacyl-(acyl-carrier-protein) synthase